MTTSFANGHIAQKTPPGGPGLRAIRLLTFPKFPAADSFNNVLKRRPIYLLSWNAIPAHPTSRSFDGNCDDSAILQWAQLSRRSPYLKDPRSDQLLSTFRRPTQVQNKVRLQTRVTRAKFHTPLYAVDVTTDASNTPS